MSYNIFIFYPEIFKVKSKFFRKLNNIFSKVLKCNIYFFHDRNHYIKKFFDQYDIAENLIEIENISDFEITHAIIFDDGDELAVDVYNYLKNNNITTRLIKIKITKVLNIDVDLKYKAIKSNAEYEYIGRGSNWGNPYAMTSYSNEDREKVINLFKYDFEKDILLKVKKQEVYKLLGKKLGCFCKPFACHGDILADYLNSWDDGK